MNHPHGFDPDSFATPLEKCHACKGDCCRHIAMQIDRPSCKRDYDNIRWFLLHRDVAIFVDHDGDWLLEVTTPCERLNGEYRCSNYEARPRVCRTYPADDEQCEFDADEPPWTRRFTSVEEFETYLDSQGIDWRWNDRKRRRPPLPTVHGIKTKKREA